MLLPRPLGALAQLVTADMQLRRLGRVVVGLVVLRRGRWPAWTLA